MTTIQHTLTRHPRYAGKGHHEFYANADNGPRISTYFLSDEEWQALGSPDQVTLTISVDEERRNARRR